MKCRFGHASTFTFNQEFGMNTDERYVFLCDLTVPQLRALACQRKISGWNTKEPSQLRVTLINIEGVEVPVQA